MLHYINHSESNNDSHLKFPLREGKRCQHLTLSANDLHVEVCQAAGDGQGQNDHAVHRHRVPVQVVEQGAVLVVLGHQPQLGPRAVICRRQQKGMVIHLGLVYVYSHT